MSTGAWVAVAVLAAVAVYFLVLKPSTASAGVGVAPDTDAGGANSLNGLPLSGSSSRGLHFSLSGDI